MIKAAIIGSTGYSGEELTGLLYKHPNVEIDFLCSHSYVGEPFSNLYGNLKKFVDEKCISDEEAFKRIKNLDILFTALPSGKALEFGKVAIENGVKFIDIGSDFRLKSKELYKEWYNLDHKYTNLLETAIYGLPELNRSKIKEAKLIANPGCYPTASTLALAPLVKNNIIDTKSIIIDAKSGVSGAGRKASVANLFVECNDSIKAYGVATHRHTPEIEQNLSELSSKEVILTFTPHLIPMSRGILSVCYGNLINEMDAEELMNLYRDFYKDEYFVRIIDELPETRWVKGSNFCDISVRVDKRTNRVIVISAIDNLMKGAAGQAVQNMNLMFGLKENTAIEMTPIFP
ncbi:N-acetyl-gamma-glutamyl-phosphate reductase [Clostridium arbusti]|uniref:N-acetyl-gamma-glutamyl-phosphate reductase n=1 Tax=Clostridium arbusti TaxID=1137848 RepID=UPI000288FE10|nr:N-acetyl-gamma-glutamyl-phosphate reductase [Clostridium arbusti]